MHIDDSGYNLKFSVECYITCKNKILLFKRSESAKNFPSFWSIPGGHLDLDEDVLTACIREVYEETGIKVTPSNVKLKYLSHHKHLDRKEVWNIFGFKVDLESETQVVNSDEGDCGWFEIEETAKLKIFPPIYIYFDHALNRNSGVLYSSAEFENVELVKFTTKLLDKDY